MSDQIAASIHRVLADRGGYRVEISVRTGRSDFVMTVATDGTCRADAVERARLWICEIGEPFADAYARPGSLK